MFGVLILPTSSIRVVVQGMWENNFEDDVFHKYDIELFNRNDIFNI